MALLAEIHKDIFDYLESHYGIWRKDWTHVAPRKLCCTSPARPGQGSGSIAHLI